MKHTPEFRFTSGLSVFFPAYNDAPSLPGLLAKTFRVLRRHVDDYEVIVVNDGSADDTGCVLEQLQKEYGNRLRVVTHEVNRGYGGALRSGFEAATKEYVFYTDGDGQYDVSELPKLLKEAGPDVGLVNGYKIKRHDPWHRIWIGATYNQFARLLFRVHLRDIDCDYRLVRKATLDRINLTSTSGTVCVELVKKVEQTGTRVVEVPVSHLPRLFGRSQFFRLQSLLTTLGQLLNLYGKVVLAPWLREIRPSVLKQKPEMPVR
jgi:glycosyltransferase involved in cell wall biosynthesis